MDKIKKEKKKKRKTNPKMKYIKHLMDKKRDLKKNYKWITQYIWELSYENSAFRVAFGETGHIIKCIVDALLVGRAVFDCGRRGNVEAFFILLNEYGIYMEFNYDEWLEWINKPLKMKLNGI